MNPTTTRRGRPPIGRLSIWVICRESQWVYAPGQSGQLGSPHYDDLIDAWRTGQTIPMLWTREQVEGAAEGRLVLKS